MEPNSAIRELCKGQIRVHLISLWCTSVIFCKDTDRLIRNEKYWLSVAHVRKYFIKFYLSSASTYMVHYLAPINYPWSKQFIWKALPIWMLQKNIQWSCTNSSIWIWMTWHQCWRFWNTLHKKGSSYIFSHRLYSISAYGIDLPPHKLDIRRSKY